MNWKLILSTGAGIVLFSAVFLAALLINNPSIQIAIIIFLAAMLGGLAGYGAYYVKNKSYFEKKSIVKDPKKLLEALNKNGTIVDNGEQLTFEIVNEAGKPTLAVQSQHVTPRYSKIEEAAATEKVKKIQKKQTNFFEKVLKGGGKKNES